MLVEFTDQNGNRLAINPKDVSSVYDNDDRAEIYMSGNARPIYLDETFEAVVKKLNEAP